MRFSRTFVEVSLRRVDLVRTLELVCSWLIVLDVFAIGGFGFVGLLGPLVMGLPLERAVPYALATFALWGVGRFLADVLNGLN